MHQRKDKEANQGSIPSTGKKIQLQFSMVKVIKEGQILQHLVLLIFLH